MDVRFIPAYAGNTTATLFACSAVPVHPRLRGEHREFLPKYNVEPGSSPPTRGTPDESDLGQELRRFIPAYAGNTLPLTI